MRREDAGTNAVLSYLSRNMYLYFELLSLFWENREYSSVKGGDW